MSDIADLVKRQEQNADSILRVISNYRKCPKDRKTEDHLQQKSKELKNLWKEFEKLDNSIRRDPIVPKDHPYYGMEMHTSLGEKYYQAMEDMQASIKALRAKPAAAPRAKDDVSVNAESGNAVSNGIASVEEVTANAHLGNLQAHFGASSAIVEGLIRKQRAVIQSLQRIDDGIHQEQGDHPPQYYEVKMQTISRLWQQIEDINLAIWELTTNPAAYGHDADMYVAAEHIVQTQLVDLSVKARGHQVTSTIGQGTLKLPTITIPKFSGNYADWRQFHDLFKQMVHNQPIANVQKLWYLKTNVTSEAAELIRHLSATEDNYATAWKLLEDRYNNKRVLINTLMDKLLQQPTGVASAVAIKRLHDTTQECLFALNNLDVDTKAWDPILLYVLVKKLDRSTHIRYEQSISSPKEPQRVDDFLAFLEKLFQSMEATGHKERASTIPRTIVSAVTSHKGSNTCRYCNTSSHPLYYCKQFLQLTTADRLNWVQKQKLCVNCFKQDHVAKNCTARSCSKCDKKHNSLLHLQGRSDVSRWNPSPTSTTAIKSTETNTAVTSAATNTVPARHGYVLLATAKVKVTAANGRTAEFRAILDSGSQVNIVSERLIRRLSIIPIDASLCIEGIGQDKKRTTQRVNVNLQSFDNSFSTRVEAFVLPNIISAQPNHKFDISTWSIPTNIQLADPEFHQPGKIDILLGAEFYSTLMTPGQINLSANLPVLQNTILGWIISGKIGSNSESSDTLTCAVFGGEADLNDNNASLEEVVERLWKMDEVDAIEKGLSPTEQRCEAHFAQNVRTNEQGRFVVKLPFLENTSALGSSREMAYSRFLSLERRLLKNDLVRTQYSQFMEEYKQLGHMTEVKIESVVGPSYFIPHHCVLKPDSTTTKLRVVFDASAKTTSGYSLNDLMHTGPTIQSELFSILLRFRLPRFVFTTDIEKMYRQILIHPDDHQHQTIMWRNHPASSIGYYQLNTVTYGTRAAPYLATKCLQRVALDNINKFPLGAKMLQHNFYVDDGLGGSDNLTTAIETQHQLIHILKERGFNLRKWCSNHPQLLRNIPIDDQEVNLDFTNTSNDSIKTLGLLWLPKTDHFCFKVRLGPVMAVTKRTVTSDIARLFDPLGIVAPVIVTAKMFIQELWQSKIDWDEALPVDLHRRWMIFRNNLTGRRIVRLLCAKSRVAPLKKQTLPRLELCAAVLTAPLINRVRNDLDIKEYKTFLWTDSEIVLSWINAQSSSFQTFVANRVATIQTLSLADHWRHVRSKDNPADVLSRGLFPSSLAKCDLWFYGPLFLHGKETIWPSKFNSTLAMSTNMERKRKLVVSQRMEELFGPDSDNEVPPSPAASENMVLTVTENDNTASARAHEEWIDKFNHRNSFRTLQRSVGYMLRFINNTRRKGESQQTQTALTPTELDQALIIIVKAIQGDEFKHEISYVKKYKEFKKTSPFSSLSPFIDDKGVLRVGGRLKAAPIPYDAKHQMLLPYNDPLVKLLMQQIHKQNRHYGAQTLLAIMRRRFWPIKGKCMARSIVQHCITCNKAKPRLLTQVMGNLPATRVTPARPFTNTGVDYCGPFWVHFKLRGKRPQKAYIAVFCCFATKAVHLELVTDLTTDAFIGALKRFISRRGHCKMLYSDNATNFVGAKNQLAELTSAIHSPEATSKITVECSNKGIQFNFIPPRAPHFGGLWEAAVKSAKHLLLRSVSTASLTYEELETVVVEIEAILNSRPLTPMSDDPNDLSALTPGHFLIGEALTTQVDATAEPLRTNLVTRWILVSHLKHEFWRRWSRDYLCELQHRRKWKNQATSIKIGDMVIIKEDNMPVLQWPLGRIVATYEGDDGATRVADVTTSSGVWKRSIHRLAPLPIENTSEQSITSMSQPCQEDASTPPPQETSKVPRKRKRMLLGPGALIC